MQRETAIQRLLKGLTETEGFILDLQLIFNRAQRLLQAARKAAIDQPKDALQFHRKVLRLNKSLIKQIKEKVTGLDH